MSDQLQERIALLRTLKAVYERQLTAVRRKNSLRKEEVLLKETLESQQGLGISQSPPYSLGLYDSYNDKLAAMIRKEESVILRLKIAEKQIHEADLVLRKSQQDLRRIDDEFEGLPDKTVIPDYKWKLKQAKFAEESAQANLMLQKINHQNARAELRIVGLSKGLVKKQVNWIKSHLAYDSQDLEKQLGRINERRAKLQKRIKTLIHEQKQVEKTWLKAQKAYEKGQESDDAALLADALLNERKAWRETYQKVLEQTEYMLQLLSIEEQTWKHRYALIRGDLSPDVLEVLQNETKTQIAGFKRLIGLQQQSQTHIQTRITAIRKQLAEKEIGPRIKKHVANRLKAVEKLAERTVEYLSALQSAKEKSTRLADELSREQDNFSIAEKMESFGSRVIQIWEFELWVIDNHAVTVKKIFMALAILLLGIIIVKGGIKFVRIRLLPRTHLDENVSAVIEKLLYYFALFLILMLVLKTVNIPLTAFTFLGGAIAIGIGFGAQNLINNFISGFIIMLERPIKIGDMIEMENSFGTIEEIGARCTRIRTAGNVHILVPNSSFLEKNITNRTLSDQRVRANVSVGVVYGSDTGEVARLLKQAVCEQSKVFDSPEPFVLFNDFGDNALIFNAYFWISMNRLMERRIIESDIRFRIEQLFTAAGIVIAFPQQDTHLYTSRPLELKMLKIDEDK